MTARCLLLLALTVVCSVEPIEVLVKYNLIVDEGGYTVVVVSDNEMVVSHRERLLFKNLNGTLLSEADLGYQPDKLYANSLNGGTHIVAAAHTEHSSLNKVSYCTYYATRDQALMCRPAHSFTPPAKFVLSMDVLVDENRVTVRAIYYDDSDHHYHAHNLKGGVYEYFDLPANCTCSNHSHCLKQHDEPNGKVLVQCDSGTSYLYGGQYYVSPPKVKRVATSKYMGVILAVQPAEGQFQDDLIETNMVTDIKNASAQPALPGVLANSSNPVTIQDVVIVPVNETSHLEVCFLIRGIEILYFTVVDLGMVPEIKHLLLPTGLTPIGFRGTYDSSIAVEGVYSNGSSVIMVIEACESQPEGADPPNNNTGTDSLPPPSSHPTSGTPQDHNNTDPPGPRTTDETKSETPTGNPDSVNSATTRDYSTSFVVIIAVSTFVAGVVLALAFVMLVMLLRRLRKSTGYNIELTERTGS